MSLRNKSDVDRHVNTNISVANRRGENTVNQWHKISTCTHLTQLDDMMNGRSGNQTDLSDGFHFIRTFHL